VCTLVRMRLRHPDVVRRHTEWLVPDASSAEAEAVLREDQREVVAALHGLPERQRQARPLQEPGRPRLCQQPARLSSCMQA